MKRLRRLDDLGSRLGALGEAWRLRLLRLLEAEELSVGEIARVMQLPQSTVSRRLKTLADGGWIARRSEGTATLAHPARFRQFGSAPSKRASSVRISRYRAS